jgi:2'-5' RNA ligase
MTLSSLSEYAKHKDGTYVALQMSSGSKDLLDNFVRSNLGLEDRVNKDSYHITVIYSRTPVPDAEKIKGAHDAMALCTGYDMFSTKDGGKCLVMRVNCTNAKELNAMLNRLGATSDYPEYKAHITIAYNITQEIDPATLPLPVFSLHFDEIHVAPLDPEFVPSNAAK